MKQLERKLRSNAGASMIFALVFLLFCVFIGGSVLAAATANAGRVASMTTDQQEYFSQRSAALVMADMLTGTDDAPMQLIIKEVSLPVTLADGSSGQTRSFTFTIADAASKPVFQRLIYENEVRKKWNEKHIVEGLPQEGKDTVLFENFLFDDMDGVNPSYVFPVTAPGGTTFSISDPLDASKMISGSYEWKNNCDLYVSFGECAQVYLFMNGYVSEPKVTEIEKEGKTITTTTTIIRWDPPVIEKGGVSDE